MKHLIIFNPGAGNSGDGAQFEEVIKKSFEGLDYEIYKTEGPRKVIPFLRDYFKKNNQINVILNVYVIFQHILNLYFIIFGVKKTEKVCIFVILQREWANRLFLLVISAFNW